MEGLSDPRPRPAQDHDARRRRVHPSLSPARAAQRLPPHPPLRPVRRRGSCAQHRARPPSARRATGHARSGGRWRRGLWRQGSFAGAPMPVLRRPDDHRRDVRESRALRGRHRRAGSGSTPHDHRRASRLEPPIAFAPPARRSRRPTSSRGRQSSPDRRARARAAHPRDRTRSSSSFPPPRLRATGPRSDTREPSAILKSP